MVKSETRRDAETLISNPRPRLTIFFQIRARDTAIQKSERETRDLEIPARELQRTLI